MSIRHLYFKVLLFVTFALFITACGGGGGGGGGSADGVHVNTSAISFAAEYNGALPSSKSYSITWSNPNIAGVLIGVPPNETVPNWINISHTNNSSPINLTLTISTTNLTPGTYTMTLRIVSGTSNAVPINTVDIPLEYTVHEPVTVSPLNLSFDATEGVPADPKDVVASSPTVTPALIAFDDVAWLDQTVSGTTVTVTPNVAAALLPVGTHTGTVTVQYTISSLVTRNIPITYTVTPALSGPAAIDIQIDGATIAGDLQHITRSITSNRASPINWTASETQDWLTLNTDTGDTRMGNNLSVDIDEAVLQTLENGTYQTSITISSADPNVSDLIIPINLVVNLPEVHFVAPYVAYTATVDTDYIIIRGEGLTNYADQVMLGGVPAGSVTIISDTELNVTPPALSLGTHTIEVKNALGYTRQTKPLVVKDPPTSANTTLAVDFDYMESIVYDAERELLFTAQCYLCSFAGSYTYISSILKFSYNSTDSTWGFTAYPYTNLLDIAMTPDGQHLVVLTLDNLILVNPVTMVTEETINLPFPASGTNNALAVLNNGYIVVASLNSAYSLVDQGFIQLPGNLFYSATGIVTSADGSRAVYGVNNLGGTRPFRYIDASTMQEVAAPGTYNYLRPSYDRHADRLYSENNILDGNFNLLDTVPFWSPTGVISPDGQMAYAFDYNTTQIRKFDLSGTPPFSELTPVDVTDPESARLGISQDGSLLFVVGLKQFIVLNVP